MRARLKKLTSDEIPDLEAFVPAVPDEFAVNLVLEVGPLGLRGREEFELLVVTPRWLLKRHGAEGLVPGRGKLLVFEWSFERIRSYLARKVEACAGRSWPEVARKVSAIAEWQGDEENVIGLRRG
jgi:hypothetical protein